MRLYDRLETGPVVLTFYRGDWCPFCSIELRALSTALPMFEARGASLVAISPQAPDRALGLKQRESLTFDVLSDVDQVVTLEPVRFGNSTRMFPDADFAACSELDVLIVPGGGGSDEASGRIRQQTHRPTLDFIRKEAKAGALVASVCTGAFLLGGAGLLAERRASTHWYSRDELLPSDHVALPRVLPDSSA